MTVKIQQEKKKITHFPSVFIYFVYFDMSRTSQNKQTNKQGKWVTLHFGMHGPKYSRTFYSIFNSP